MKTYVRASVTIASGFYSGFSPIAPGTVGSLVVACAYPLLASAELPIIEHLAVAAAIAVLGIITTNVVLSNPDQLPKARKKSDDPHYVVVDEFAGMWVALLTVSPRSWSEITLAFFLFRLFDVLKPGPVRWAERLPRGTGVMMDDLVAGLLAAAVLQILRGALA